MPRLLRPLLATSSLVCAWPLMAAAQVPTPPETISLDEIRVQGEAATRGYQPLRSSVAGGGEKALTDIPQSVSVVPPQVLRDQAARSLDDALVNVAGVLQANTLGGTQDAFVKRGFGDNRDGSIMRDGLRVAMPRAFDASAERVEVLKGPATLMFGILDPGGMVNIVTKKPELTQKGSIETRVGSFGGGKSGAGTTFDVTGPVGQSGFAYRVIADAQTTDYWREYGINRTRMVAPSLTYFGPDTTVRAYALYSSYEVPFDRGTVFDPATGRPVHVPAKRRFDERYNVTRGENQLAGIEIDHRFNADWSLKTHYAYSHNWYGDNQARVTAYNSRTGALTRRADATQDSNLDVHALRIDLTGRQELFGFTNEFLIGASYDYSKVIRTDLIRGPTSTAFNINRPIHGLLPSSYNVIASDSDQTDRLETAAAYIQDTLWLTDKLAVVGGARVQAYDEYAGRGRPFAVNTDVSGNKIIPRAGILYKVTPDISVYGSYTESFKPNVQIAQSIGSLPPEEGKSYEVGAKAELPFGLTATAAVFDIDKRNVLYNDVVGGITVARTAGRVRSRGAEVELSGNLTSQLSIIANYAYTDLKVSDDPTLAPGSSLPNVARNSGALFMAYDFGAFGPGTLRAGGGVRYVGERPGDAANSFNLPEYAVTDLFVAYDTKLGSHPLNLQLNIKNLFDKVYYPSSVNNLNVSVGEPFQALVTARLGF